MTVRFNVVYDGIRTTARINPDVWELFVNLANGGCDDAARASFMTYFNLGRWQGIQRGQSASEYAHQMIKNLIYSQSRCGFQALYAGEKARKACGGVHD